MKKNILRSLLTVALIYMVSCAGKEEKGKAKNTKKALGSRKNVLLIYVDDMTQRLGYFGDSIAQTPNIDKLASEGVAFQNAYCQFPLCNPSRTSMLTGLSPSALGIKSLGVHFRDKFPGIVTLPQLFRENGYHTARAGKVYHMGVPDAIAVGGAGGDDAKSWDKTYNCRGYELNCNGHYQNATPWREDTAGAGGAIAWLWAEKGDDKHHDHHVTDSIIKELRRHKDEPFFLAAGYIRPHVPWVAPKRFFEMYDTAKITLPPAIENDRDDIPPLASTVFGARFNVNPVEHKLALQAYYACVSFVDYQVGRLMKALDDLDLRKNTVVVFVSDHGFQLGEHGYWFKYYLLDQSTRSPLIIASPEHAASNGQQCRKPAELLDVYPTLADLCRLQAPDNLEGISMRPLLENPKNPWKNAAFVDLAFQNRFEARSAKTERWSYNRWNDGQDGEELYDLTNDPYELHNLAGNAQFADTLKAMRLTLKNGR